MRYISYMEIIQIFFSKQSFCVFFYFTHCIELHFCLGELSCRPPCLYSVADSSISRIKINTKTGNQQGAIEKVLDIGSDIWKFAIDPVNKKLYTVSVSGIIYKSNLNGTDNKKLPFIGSIHKLAFDWTSNNIYFLDSNEKTVQVYNVENQFKKVLFQLDADVLSICINPIAG